MTIKNRLIGIASSYIEPYPTQVQGESSYKANIKQICGIYDEEKGYNDDSHIAALYLEDDNPLDPGNAVRIEINDLTVGHLSRVNAKTYRQRLVFLNAPVNSVAICAASIRGGFLKEGEIADFGVRLDFEIDKFSLKPVKYEGKQIKNF